MQNVSTHIVKIVQKIKFGVVIVDNESNIINALLVLCNEGKCVKQLEPVLRIVKKRRLLFAAANILEWTAKQKKYINLARGNQLDNVDSKVWHIGYPQKFWNNDADLVDPDILLIINAFDEDYNYFTANTKDFTFNASLTNNEREQIAEKVSREWKNKGRFFG